MSFVGCESWQLRYQRNNKQSGLKNIRCFPACSNPHRLRGFCGNSITFQLDRPIPYTITFGEFALKDSQTIRVGQTITNDEILENERVDDLFKPWHRGEVQDAGRIVFNKQKKGWHYSWVSNKHTSDSEHVFRVYFFDQAGPTTYRCVATYDSPAFTIFCRRRDKSGVDNLPPQFMNSVNPSKVSESDGSDDDDDDDYSSQKKPSKRRESTRSSKRTKVQSFTQAIAQVDSTAGASSVPKPPLKEEYAAVFRILAALTNVHDRQQQSVSEGAGSGISSSSSAAKAALMSASISNPATPSTTEGSDDPDNDLFDITKAISDCWDWVSPDGSINDSQFFDTFFSNPSAKPLEEMLLRLGQHLLKEDFTKEIEEVFATKATVGDSSKRQILNCLREKCERFFEREGTSLARFDADLMSQNPQLAEEKTRSIQLLFPTANQPGFAFHNALPDHLFRGDTNLFRPPFRMIHGGVHDFTGHWRRPASTLEILEKLRRIIGFSWIERKLMVQMEQEFFIWYEGNTMFVRGQRKLAGSNTLVHIIDGLDYPFVQPSPILGDNTPIIGLFNRTWVTDDGFMHFMTTYTTEFRTIRSTKRSKCGNRLESTITLQKNESCQMPGIWVDLYTFPVIAERVTSY